MLAKTITRNLACESTDVFIKYPLPEDGQEGKKGALVAVDSETS
jgi:hypothetical protein